jgi:hypothetical protein
MPIFIIVGVAAGVLFGLMDGLINGNPLARRLNAVFTPVARKSLNLPIGIAIDIVYGLAMAAFFVLLYTALPGDSGPVKGLSYAVLTWFFRVVMSAVSQWMMFKVTVKTMAYNLAAGLGEMVVIGVLFGVFLKPPL